MAVNRFVAHDFLYRPLVQVRNALRTSYLDAPLPLHREQSPSLVMLASSQLPHYKDSLTSQNPSLPEPGVIFPPSPVASDEKLSLGVAGALQLLEDHRGGKLNKAWNTIQLLPGDYDELWWHIERDDALFRYVTTKVQ